jgi:hypothetical protein
VCSRPMRKQALRVSCLDSYKLINVLPCPENVVLLIKSSQMHIVYIGPMIRLESRVAKEYWAS